MKILNGRNLGVYFTMISQGIISSDWKCLKGDEMSQETACFLYCSVQDIIGDIQTPSSGASGKSTTFTQRHKCG